MNIALHAVSLTPAVSSKDFFICPFLAVEISLWHQLSALHFIQKYFGRYRQYLNGIWFSFKYDMKYVVGEINCAGSIEKLIRLFFVIELPLFLMDTQWFNCFIINDYKMCREQNKMEEIHQYVYIVKIPVVWFKLTNWIKVSKPTPILILPKY